MLGINYKKKKQGLTVEMVRKPIVYIVYTASPLSTLRAMAILFEEQKVLLERMQLNRFRSGEAMVIVHCLIESERVSEIERKLNNLPGVKTVEKVVS